MPNPYDVALRWRAVLAYERGEGSHAHVAALFNVHPRTLERWVARWRSPNRSSRSRAVGAGIRRYLPWPVFRRSGVAGLDRSLTVWVQRGEEYVEPRPMNCGDNLTPVGAIRRDGWVVLNTKWRAMNKRAFITWVRHCLAPRLRSGDIVVLDNLAAHEASEVRVCIEARGARVKCLPP